MRGAFFLDLLFAFRDYFLSEIKFDIIIYNNAVSIQYNMYIKTLKSITIDEDDTNHQQFEGIIVIIEHYLRVSQNIYKDLVSQI